MALTAPGVEVTIIDESFYIPSVAPTVPLMFVATAEEKTQDYRDTNSADAAGTFESNQVREITSIAQSQELFGIPNFFEDSNGEQHYGDARNEYGLLALNGYLSVGNRAYVVRSDCNLNDDIDFVRDLWDKKAQETQLIFEAMITTFINAYNEANGLVPGDAGYKESITIAEYKSLVQDAFTNIFEKAAFGGVGGSLQDDFYAPTAPLDIYIDGYNMPSTGTYDGLEAMVDAWVSGTIAPTEFTAAEAGVLFLDAANDFPFTLEFRYGTSLGANDAARLDTIQTCLSSSIVGTPDLLTALTSDFYDFNIIVCPGPYDVVQDLETLNSMKREEAFIIADTPFDKSPEEVVAWAAALPTVADPMIKISGSYHVAYYYSHPIMTNLDGKRVMGTASAVALRTYAFSDEVSEFWFAPAFARRGSAVGVSGMGFLLSSTTLGEPNEADFRSAPLNEGQQESMYRVEIALNPIAYLTGIGWTVWGQRTSYGLTSALDRVNVSRLMKFMKRTLRMRTLPWVGEPNDQITRDSLKAAVDGFLGNLLSRRALYDFATDCSENNNTPQRIDENQLWIDIAVRPVKAAEFIHIPIRVVATGSEI